MRTGRSHRATAGDEQQCRDSAPGIDGSPEGESVQDRTTSARRPITAASLTSPQPQPVRPSCQRYHRQCTKVSAVRALPGSGATAITPHAASCRMPSRRLSSRCHGVAYWRSRAARTGMAVRRWCSSGLPHQRQQEAQSRASGGAVPAGMLERRILARRRSWRLREWLGGTPARLWCHPQRLLRWPPRTARRRVRSRPRP